MKIVPVTAARRVEPLMADTQSLFLVKDFMRQYGRSDTTDRVLGRLIGNANEAIRNEARRLFYMSAEQEKEASS